MSAPPPPTVSVLLPVRNGGPFLAAALRSILDQRDVDLELVTGDDGSTDGSDVTLRILDDPRVKLVDLPQSGIAAALNALLAAARGSVIARMDADDVSRPDRLVRQLALLRGNPETVLVGCAFAVIDAAGRTRSVIAPPTQDDDIRRRLLLRNPLAHGSLAMRTDALRSLGGYDPRYRSVEDLELIQRMAGVGRLAACPEVLYDWRVHGHNISVSERPQEVVASADLLEGWWRSHPPARRHRRDLLRRADEYRAAGGSGPLVAQYLETELQIAVALLSRGRRRDGMAQLSALASLPARHLRLVAADVPPRALETLRHRGVLKTSA